MLFTAVVLGLTSVGQLLLSSPGDTVLTSAHMGTAAGVTAMVGYSIDRPRGWRWLNWLYAFVVFVAGIVLHGMIVPAILAIGLGIPSAVVLLRITWLHRSMGKHTPIPS
ncbi:hypothetical protein SAMN05661093_06262 [Kibdelosporangium aridum]|uniref:Uncharacterized protein n=1 Tax=Kibdelosporangium aridum TaxID=2030 RepID=A0A1W2FF39_KIBAR|nr:hypothetical protein SAMN05661093_06262 [Kibdelosporangium aridum]